MALVETAGLTIDLQRLQNESERDDPRHTLPIAGHCSDFFCAEKDYSG
jgi:hypothetical protein